MLIWKSVIINFPDESQSLYLIKSLLNKYQILRKDNYNHKKPCYTLSK